MPASNPYMCYNYGKGGHKAKDCPQPKRMMDLKDVEEQEEENDDEDESGKANA
jgi:hypothetical protein